MERCKASLDEIALSQLITDALSGPGKPCIDEESHRFEENKRLEADIIDLEGFVEECLLEGKDRRLEVDKPHEWPYRAQGKLVYDDKISDIWEGSGTIIGPNLVLTAAHVVISRESNPKELDKNRISFYYTTKKDKLEKCKILEVYCPKEYMIEDEEEWEREGRVKDYAILVLDKDIGNQTGFLKIYPYKKSTLSDKEAYIYGYDETLKGMSGKFNVLESDIIEHFIDTTDGQSGAAIYIKEDEEFYIIGVHVLGYKDSNYAIYINEDKLNRFEPYLKLSKPLRAARAPSDTTEITHSSVSLTTSEDEFQPTPKLSKRFRAARARSDTTEITHSSVSLTTSEDEFQPTLKLNKRLRAASAPPDTTEITRDSYTVNVNSELFQPLN